MLKQVILLLILSISSLLPQNSLASFCGPLQGCPGTKLDKDMATFSVTGTFFNPIINFTYGREHSHRINLIVKTITCNSLCSSSYTLNWWGQCLTNGRYDKGDRVCARLIQQAGQTFICVFYDPLDDGVHGLDTIPELSPFHGEITTPNIVSCSQPTYGMRAFTSTNGSIYIKLGDAPKINTPDQCAGVYLSGTGVTMPLSFQKLKPPTCEEVFTTAECSTPSTLDYKKIGSYLATQGLQQIYPTAQAQQYVNSLKTNANLSPKTLLNAPLPNNSYNSNDSILSNPVVCAVVPVAPAPPPFCTPMPVESPSPQAVNLCTLDDFVGYASAGALKKQILYNTPASSTLNIPCEVGTDASGKSLYNSYIAPAARITFQNPMALIAGSPQASVPPTSAAPFFGTIPSNQTSNIRTSYGPTGTNFNYATSQLSSFDNTTGETLSPFAAIGGNVANYADLTFNIGASGANTKSATQAISDPDGNPAKIFYLATVPDSDTLLAGTYVFSTNGANSYTVAAVNVPHAPKPIVAPCGGSNSDNDIKVPAVSGGAWTISKTNCTSTHSNPAIAWSVDRTSNPITSTAVVDYKTSYLNQIQLLQNITPTSVPPSLFNVTLTADVVNEKGIGIPAATGTPTCSSTTPPVYGCYYNPDPVNNITCGSFKITPDPTSKTASLYLSGLEFMPDTDVANQLSCTDSNQKTITFSPLKYYRGGKFACAGGASDVGNVLVKFAGWKNIPNYCNTEASFDPLSNNDITQRADPLYSPPAFTPYAPSNIILSALGNPATTLQYFTDVGINSTIGASPNTQPAYLASLKLSATQITQQDLQGCTNMRNKFPLESGLCVPIPQPTCDDYSTNYTAAASNTDPVYKAQQNDGFANWSIPAGQVYGTVFSGTCLAGTMPAENGLAPIRFCTLDPSQQNDQTLPISQSIVYNACIPVPPTPSWWPTNMQYTSLTGAADILTPTQWIKAWNDNLNITFTDFTNQCIDLAGTTDAGGNTVTICRGDNTYYYYSYSNSSLRGPGQQLKSDVYVSPTQQQCIPQSVQIYQQNATGSVSAAYLSKYHTQNSKTCCPSTAPSDGQITNNGVTTGICCPDHVKVNGLCPKCWTDGTCDNSCLVKDTCDLVMPIWWPNSTTYKDLLSHTTSTYTDADWVNLWNKLTDSGTLLKASLPNPNLNNCVELGNINLCRGDNSYYYYFSDGYNTFTYAPGGNTQNTGLNCVPHNITYFDGSGFTDSPTKAQTAPCCPSNTVMDQGGLQICCPAYLQTNGICNPDWAAGRMDNTCLKTNTCPQSY